MAIVGVETLREIHDASRELLSDWWRTFLRQDGLDWMQQMLIEHEAADHVRIQVRVHTPNGRRRIPDAIGLMILARAAIGALTLSLAIERARTNNEVTTDAQDRGA